MYSSKFQTIGAVIYHLRTKKQISQGLLSKGLCSPSTLCRIELGEREPDKLLADALLQRLGTSPNRFDFFLDEEEFYFFNKREAIKLLIKTQQYHQAQKELSLYESQIKPLTSLQLQFIKKQKGLISWFLRKNDAISIKNLKEALYLTLPSYNISNLSKLFLTLEEISILYEICTIYRKIGKHTHSLFILAQLIPYLENEYIDEEEQAKLYNPLIFSAAYQYYMQGNYAHTLYLCKKGIVFSSKNGKLHYLPELLCLRALSQEKIYKASLPLSIQYACLQDYFVAISLYSLYDQKPKATEIKNYIKEIYPWESIQSAMLFKNQEFLLI